MFDLQVEVGLDLRMALDEGKEDISVEFEGFEIAERSHRRGPGASLEQRHLAEAVAGAHDIERYLVAVSPCLEYLRAAGRDHVIGVRLISFRDDIAPESK